MPGGLRHGLRHPAGRVDLTVYRNGQPDRQPLVAALVLVVAGLDQAQQLVRGLRRNFLTGVVIEGVIRLSTRMLSRLVGLILRQRIAP